MIATLTFKVAETVKSGDFIDISLYYDPGAIIDNDLKPLDIKTVSGGITAIDYTPGDVNNDGTINTSDCVTLRRYVAKGYNVNIKELAGDVNADGMINTSDVVFLRRYVARGYDVTLLPGKASCKHKMEKINGVEPTCTEDGNIEYWHCTLCDRCFKDDKGNVAVNAEDTVIKAKGHVPVVDPAVKPTYESTGLQKVHIVLSVELL